MSDIVRRNPAQELARTVRSAEVTEQLAAALPPNVTVERFVRIATTAILTDPSIAELEHGSVLTALVKCAAMGLLPDGKQAAIVARKGKATLVPMIQGFRDIAADHGWTLRTAVVYENDTFEHAVIDGEERINHIPVRPGNPRGQLIASYAIMKHRDGRKLMTVLHPDDIALRRASASTQNVWNAHTAAMWEKSAGRDVFAQAGLGEIDERVQRVLEAEHRDAAEAETLIYGTEIQDAPAALPSPAPEPSASVGSPGGLPDATDDGGAGTGQQAAADVTPAAAAPGPDEEPGPEPETSFVAPQGSDDDPAVFMAREAAHMVVPIGKWQGHTLGQVQAAGASGESWLKYALASLDDSTGTGKTADPKYRRGEFVQALYAFCRVFEPELFQEALAAKEAAA